MPNNIPPPEEVLGKSNKIPPPSKVLGPPKKKKSPSKGSQFYSKALEEVGLSAIDRPEKQKASVFSPSNIKELAKSDEQKFTETQRKLKSQINELEVEQELSDTEMAQILKWSEEDVKRAKQGVPSKNVVAKPANIDPKSTDTYRNMMSGALGMSINQMKAYKDIESKKYTDSKSRVDDLKSKVKYYDNVDTQERLKNKGYDIDINGDLNDEKTKSALNKENAKWKAFKIEEAKKNDVFDKIDENIDLNLISNTEEYVVDQLRKKFSGSGFVFEESGMGNYLTVKFIPHDGDIKTLELGESKQIEIPLGGRGSLSIAKEGNYSDGLSEDNAKKLRDFMKGAYMTNAEWRKFSPTEEEIKNGRGDSLSHLTWMLKSTNLMAKNPAKYGKELIGDDQVENVLERASFDIKDEYKWLEGEYANLKKQIDTYNQNPTDAGRVTINNRMHELAVKEYKLNEKANEISEVDKNWNKITGAYALEQSKKGTFGGYVWSGIVSGLSLKSVQKMMVGLSMDVGVSLMDAENLTDASTYQMYKDGGLSDDDIKEKVLAEAKRFIMPRLDEAYTSIATLGTTTEEYKKSPDRSLFENVIAGLAESAGTQMSGLGSLGFFANAYDSMQTQMLGKEFDGLTQSEKMLIAVPYGLVVGALEEFGYNASTGFSKSGLFNKLVNKIIRKSLTDLPKDATIGEIKREINKNVGTLVKSGAIKIAAGSITEGNVEGLQGLTETSTKFLVNELYDKELFQNVPDISTKDGLIEAVGMASEDAALGALGGLIMGGGAISTTTYKQAKFNETSDYKFDHFYGTLMDDNLRKSIKYNTKIKLKNGEITESQAKEELESIDRNAGILRSIPTELSLRDKKDSFNLIIERNRLEQEIDGKDAALIVKQKARISEINSELNKISENATKENNVEQQKDTTEGSKVEYQGAVKGQQEVGTTEGTVGQTTQQKADTGDSTVASEVQQEEVKTLRAQEQQELNEAIPNIEEYIVNGEINKESMPADVLAKYNEIYDKYDAKITPLLPATETAATQVEQVTPTQEKTFEVHVGGIESGFTESAESKDKSPGDIRNEIESAPEDYGVIVTKGTTNGATENDTFVVAYSKIGGDRQRITEKNGGRSGWVSASVKISENATEQEIAEAKAAATAKMNAILPNIKGGKFVLSSVDASTSVTIGEAKTGKAVAEQEVVAEVKPAAKTVEQEVEEIGQLVEGSDIEIDRIANTISDKRMAKVVARSAKALSRIAPGVKFKIHATDAEYRLAVDESTEGASSNGTFDPATNTVHVNLENANNRTVAHEVFHAILLNKVRTNKDATAVTNKMIEAISSKLDGNSDLKKYLDDFASNYEENIQSEEKLSELVGILAENYMNAPTSVKDVIYRWIDRLAKMFGLDPFQRNEVYDMLNTIARKTAKGKVIKESDVKIIESVDNGTIFESEYVNTNGTVVNTKSVRKSKLVNTVVNKSDIIDPNDLEGKPLEIVYYDNFTSSPYELKNRVSGSTVKRKGEGGPGYSYRDEIRSKNIIAAFTTVTKGLNLIQGVRSRNEIAGEPAVVGVALQNKETGHLGNKTTARDFYSPVDGQIAQAVNDGLLSEQEAVKMLKGAVVAYESTKKGQDPKSSLGFTSNDFNSLNEFFDKIYNISFERRGTFNAIAVPSKPSLKITSATKPYVVTWLNAGIPTLNEYYEETTEQYTKEAEAHDIVKYLDPKLDVIGIDSSVNVSEKEIERAKDMGVEIVTIDDSLTHTSYPVVLFGKNIGIPSTFNSVRDMAQEWNVPNPFFKAGRRSDKSEPVRIPKREATSRKPGIRKQKPVAGNKLFNEPLKDASTIADRYAKKSGITMQEVIPVTSLDKENSKAISDEFEKMKDDPTNPEVAAAYNKMAEETIAQYKEIVKDGYFVEINNEEPYSSSEDMIKDLKENKRFKVFSTESGFGDTGITEKQRSENPLLKDSGFKDVNGETLLVNDVFRFVHDFFGHAKFGNSFGPIGEENAWMIHSVMYSPLARRAMTSETRGQNSYVNFSGVNEEAFRLRDKARALRQEGKIEQANKLVEKVYDIMKFADQKVGLMPEWVSGTGNIDGAVKVRKQKPGNINAVIKLCKENGFSNEAITKYLKGKGFSDEQINNSLAPYIAKENAKNDFNIEYSRLIDEGATEENAFNEAMDNIVYKIEDDIVREELARELMKEYGKKIKSAPRAEKIIGKAKPITITTNDVKGLNDIIKREAKAAKDKKKQIDEVIATIAAQVKDLVTKGSISIRQMSAIINALKNTNFDNQVMVDRFMDYVLKVVSNADYIERVNKGLNFKKAIKRNLKGRANPFVSVAKSFTELNPKWVVDINKYNEIAELVFNSVKPTRITKDTVNFKKEADIETIAKYIAEEQENHLKIYEANVRDRYERITGEKSKGKTIEEMNTILVNLKGDKKDYSSQITAELKEKLAEYKKMVTNDDLAEVKAAVNVDLNLIDNEMAISILDALDTYFANGSNASLKAIMATYGGIVAVNEFNGKAKALRMLGSKRVGRFQNEQFTNINMMFKRLFRGQNAGQAFSEAIGFNNLVQGSNRAERQSVDKQNEYTKKFKNVKNFNSAENIFERNVIAWLKRRDVNANEQDSFNKRLKLLKDSVDVLRKSGTTIEKEKANVYEKVFKKLGLYDDNVSIEDVLGKSEKFNIDAVDFVTEMWSDIYNQLSDTALGVYNTMLANDINYTPDKFTNLDSSTPSEFDVESSGFMSFNSNYTLDKNSAGVLMETTRPSKLPDNMYIDLDFDRNMFRSYKLALNDMYTAEAIRHTNAFLKSDKFKEIVPTAEDRGLISSAIQGYVSAKKGKNYIEKSEMNFLNSFLDTVGGFGAVRALAGFSQFINQWSTANVNTMINAGEYMRPGDLFNKDIASMIANSGLPISNVGIEALTTIENADKELDKAGIVATVGGAIDKYTLNYLKKWNALLLKQLLANPDRFARIQAFAAYYRKSMAQQGLEVDFKAPMNEKAAKYAQSMIDANMDVSDTEMRGQFFKSKNAYVKIIKQVFFPFATFSMNQRNRVWSDAAVVVNAANNKERATAFRSLGAFSAEFFAYNGIRYGVGLLIMKGAVAALGLDDEEEEKIIKKYEENLKKSIKSSSITDVLSPTPVLDEGTLLVMNKMMPMFGIGTPTEEEFQKYIDEINEKRIYKGKEKLTEDEVALKRNKFMLDEQFQFYIDNEKSTGMIGIQLTKIQELYDIVNAYYTGKYSRERFAGGGYEEVSLSDDAKESLKYIALLKLEGTILGPRETDQIANRMFKIVKDTKTLTEAQKSKYDVIKKDYEIDPYKMSLIKTTMKTENVLKEIEYIESTGGLTEKQSKEYAKLRAFGEIDGWGLDDIRKGKTAKQIIASRQ